MHWVLIVADTDLKTLSYYDPMAVLIEDKEVEFARLDLIRKYFAHEARVRNVPEISWNLLCPTVILFSG